MKIFSKASDGGKDSGVMGYFLIEIKPLFSIVLLKFNKGSREAFHSHAFNAFTIWLSGEVIEKHLSGYEKQYHGGMLKYTPKHVFHKIEALGTTWALSFRGPWNKTWKESRNGELVTLTHGRKII